MGAAVVLALFVIFQVVAPSLISSSLVRQNMERAVARWTGHSVSIAGPADIRFWPKPRITLRDVTIRKTVEDGSERVLGHVGRLSAGFDLLEALRGDPQFKDFRLTDAQIFVVREADGRLDWTNSGLLSQAVRNVQTSGDQQILDAASDANIGEVKIRGGMLEVTNLTDGKRVRLEGIEGSLDWPSLSRGMRLQGRASFHGRPLDLDIGTPQPLLLLSGRSAETVVKVQSDLFSGSFNGVTDLASHGFLSGYIALSTSDFPSFLSWVDVDLPATTELRTLSLQAKLASNENAMRFESLTLGLNGVEASGILDLTREEGKRPRLTGTLAIGDIDFSPLLRTLGPSMIDGGEDARRLRSNLELDVRLSAQHATVGPFELDELALGIMNVGEQTRLDILDSDFESGRLTGRVATIKDGGEGALALRLMIHNADFGSIARRLQFQGPLPAATGSMEIALDVAKPLTPAAWRNAKGTVLFTSGPGILPGLNLSAIRELSARKPYFPFSEAAKGALEFQSVELNANLAEGSAEIIKGEITTASETIQLAGIVPYVNNSLALSSTIHPTGNASTAPSGFFIGGSWPDPVIWPLPQTEPRPAE
ncbi:AsmA family protein [Neorhizobium lilium]|uniref:AsmA family protein n=1 Tax=Neorhizobium lilium TaxID=2503024 RepID=UPI0013E384F0|nr:AsmA-like C-terminal region-containing protein [Neorhizobium lilium]